MKLPKIVILKLQIGGRVMQQQQPVIGNSPANSFTYFKTDALQKFDHLSIITKITMKTLRKPLDNPQNTSVSI